MKKSIYIATPMYGGMTTGFYCQSLIQIPAIAKEKDVPTAFSFMFNESLIQRARNAMTANFMKNESFTHLMFIDADIKFNAQDIFSMLEADKDIICGLYPKKEINWYNVHKAATERNVPYDQLKHQTGSIVVNLVDLAPEVTVPVNEPIEVLAGGTGFMLIKREVFERLKPHVNTYTNDVSQSNGTISPDLIYEYFPVYIKDGRLLSEDYAFCDLARQHGMKVYGAPWVNLGHFGTYLFEGGLIPAP